MYIFFERIIFELYFLKIWTMPILENNLFLFVSSLGACQPSSVPIILLHYI